MRGGDPTKLLEHVGRDVRVLIEPLEVGKGRLNATIDQATDVVRKAKGTYVGSSTSVPAVSSAVRAE